jgi:hypothetical protein
MTRTVAVLVGTLAVEDGETTPPIVGEVGHYWLIFNEARHDEPDATVSRWIACAEPLGDGAPQQSAQRWDGNPADTPPVWPTLLRGDGWAATWSAPRPVLGQVELRGTLIADLAFCSQVGVRGRITRARMVTETIDKNGPDRQTWRPIPSEQRLRDVDISPRWFDHGLVKPAGAPVSGWCFPVPGDPYIRDVGVLVDLDLDHVPPLPLRPSIVPGALAATGCDLWVADDRLPLVMRIRNRREVTVFSWAGRILDSHLAPGRRLHADPDGCWITGPDGIRRLDSDGTVRLVREECTWLAVTNRGTLAAQVLLEPGNPHTPLAVRLVDPSGAVTDVPLTDRRIDIVAPAGDRGFVLMLGHLWGPDVPDRPEGHYRARWLATLSRSGGVVEGPPLDEHEGWFAQLTGTDLPLVLHHHGGTGTVRLRRVRPDLTLDEGVVPPRTLLSGWAANGRLWVTSHPPERPGPDGWWPLPAPPAYPEDRQYWLLTELDPADLRPITNTLVHQLPHHLAVDGQGTVWVQSDGLRYCPPEDGAVAVRLDVAALLDEARSQADATGAEPA